MLFCGSDARTHALCRRSSIECVRPSHARGAVRPEARVSGAHARIIIIHHHAVGALRGGQPGKRDAAGDGH